MEIQAQQSIKGQALTGAQSAYVAQAMKIASRTTEAAEQRMHC